jgi:hypothetical protein
VRPPRTSTNGEQGRNPNANLGQRRDARIVTRRQNMVNLSLSITRREHSRVSVRAQVARGASNN